MRRYYFYRLAGLLAPRIPRRLGYAAAALAAWIWYHFGSGQRAMIQANVRRVLGATASERDVERVAKRIFRNLLKNYFDLFWLPAQSLEKMRRLIEVRGYHNVAGAYASGKGVIIVSAHMGNQEVMTHAEVITDLPITVVVERLKPEKLFRYFISLRQKGSLRMIPQDGALRDLFRTLKAGSGIALVFDRDVTDSGRVVPFFGAPAKLPDGYALLALKYRAVIVPALITRTPDDRYVIHVEEGMEYEGRADNRDDVQRVMTGVGAVVERYIRQYIDQWVYFHYVWEEDKERIKSGHMAAARASAGTRNG